MASLVDVNVLVALLHGRHSHSAKAIAWLESCTEPAAVLVCRVAHMGALRLLTRAAVMNEDLLSPSECWTGWDRLMQDERFSLVAEPEAMEQSWRKFTEALPKGQCIETDTYFAAFAHAGGYSLATFDQGFRRFSGLRLEVLA